MFMKRNLVIFVLCIIMCKSSLGLATHVDTNILSVREPTAKLIFSGMGDTINPTGNHTDKTGMTFNKTSSISGSNETLTELNGIGEHKSATPYHDQPSSLVTEAASSTTLRSVTAKPSTTPAADVVKKVNEEIPGSSGPVKQTTSSVDRIKKDSLTKPAAVSPVCVKLKLLGLPLPRDCFEEASISIWS